MTWFYCDMRLARLSRLVLAGTAIGLVGVGLCLSLLRFWILPELPRYRPQLEAAVGHLLGETLRMGALSAELTGLDPALVARDVCVLNAASSPVLCLGRIAVHLDTLATLLTAQPALHRLEISETDLSLIRDRDGHFKLAGLNASGETPAWLLATRHITLADARLHWLDQNQSAPPRFAATLTLGLDLTDGRHRLNLEAALPDAAGGIRGQVAWEGAAATGTFQLGLDQVGLDFLQSFGMAWPVRLTGGNLSGTLAGDWNASDRQTLQADLHLTETRLARPGTAAQAVSLALPHARFSLTHAGQDWQLNLSRLQPRVQSLWPESQASARVRLNEAGWPTRLSLAAGYLELADVASILRVLVPPGSRAQELASALEPTGIVRQLRFNHDPDAPPGQQWSGQAEVQNLSLAAWQGVPGMQGVTLSVDGNDREGHLDLTLNQGRLDWLRLGFRAGLPFDRLTGRADWQYTGADWHVDIPALNWTQGRSHGEAALHLTLPGEPAASPLVDIKARLHTIDAATVLNLMPRGIIPHTAHWFDQALTGGMIRQCDLTLQGPIRAFPFRHDEGRFEVLLAVEDVGLQFHPAWLPLTGTAARVRFYGPGLTVESRQGSIGQARLVDVTARVDDLLNQPWLMLDGVAEASVPDAFDLLLHSPIKRIPEQLNRLLTVSGNTRVSLGLKVPLDHRLGETEVEGTARFSGAGLRFRDLGLEVDRIEGPLDFTRERLSARGLTGRFLAHPIQVGVNQADGNILIDVNGRLDTPALGRLFTLLGGPGGSLFPQAFWQRVKGATDYRVHLAIPESLDARNSDFHLQVQSGLQGLALELPEPLGKSQAAAVPLTVDLTLRQGSDAPLEITLGNALRAGLRFAEPAQGFVWRGGSLAVGRAVPATGQARGFSLLARLERLELSEWLPLWRLLSGPTTVEAATASPDSAAQSGRMPVNLDRLELDTRHLTWRQQPLGEFRLGLNQKGNAYGGTLAGELAQGRFRANAGHLQVELDRLRWPRLKPAPAGPPADTAPASPTGADCPAGESPCLEPDRLPTLDVRVDQVFWHEVELGKLHFNTGKTPGHYQLRDLHWQAPGQVLTLEGEWNHRWGRRQTRLKGLLQLEGLDQTLSRLGWPGVVRETPARFEVSLNWPGGPPQFALDQLGGTVALVLGKGGLPRVDPGLGRVLGLLNLDTLWRRLNFDFSDLFGEGLAYDGVKGLLRLEQGQVLTDGLLIDAVPARILVSGRAGLLQHDLDQTVTVIPRTTAALPIAGALAGGPAVGAAVFVAQRLLGDQVDNITASHYRVTDSWQSPRMEKMPRGPSLEWLNRAWQKLETLSGLTPAKQPNEQE